MLRNLKTFALLLLLVTATGCRGKRASAEEERAAEGSAEQAEKTERPAPLLPDAAQPAEPTPEEGSASLPVAPVALDRAFQLKRPSLQVRPITGAQGLNHDLRAKTAAIRMHNSSIRPLMPKAIGTSVKPAAPGAAVAPR